jgi:hypothetical protein
MTASPAPVGNSLQDTEPTILPEVRTVDPKK